MRHAKWVDFDSAIPSSSPAPQHAERDERETRLLLALGVLWFRARKLFAIPFSIRGHGGGRVAPVLCFLFSEFQPFPIFLLRAGFGWQQNEHGKRHFPGFVLLISLFHQELDFLLGEARRGL